MLSVVDLKVGDVVAQRGNVELLRGGMKEGELYNIVRIRLDWSRSVPYGALDTAYFQVAPVHPLEVEKPVFTFPVLQNFQGFERISSEKAQAIKEEIQLETRRNPGYKVVNEPKMVMGTDPEMFLEDPNGKIIPAWEVLKSKEDALSVRDENFPYWDGFQAEINVVARECHAYLVDNIHIGLRRLLRDVRAKRPTARISFRNVVDVEREVLDTLPEQYVALGCSPSNNVYGLTPLQVGDGRGLSFRCAGGHIHYSVQATPKKIERAIRAVDMIAGIPSLLMFQQLDDPRRRMLYGLPGEYRTPSWGLEYRTLSSAWMCHPAIAHFTLSLVRLGIKCGLMELEDVFEYDPVAVSRIILENDLDAARKHVQRNLGRYKQFFEHIAKKGCADNSLGEGYEKVRDAALDQLTRPVGDFVELKSMEKNWLLEDSRLWKQHSSAKDCNWSSLILQKDQGAWRGTV